MNVFLIAKEGKQTSQEKESQTRKPELKSQKTSGCLVQVCGSLAQQVPSVRNSSDTTSDLAVVVYAKMK